MNDHHFNIQIAIDFDIETATFLNNLAYWLNAIIASRETSKNNHYFESRYWIYNSYTRWAEIFPYFTPKQMRRIIDNAIKNGLIIKGNFNNKRYDNTNWYTLSDKALSYYPRLLDQFLNTPAQTGKTLAQTGKTLAQTGRPIPINNPDNKPIEYTPSASESLNINQSDDFESFINEFPRKQNLAHAKKLFERLKPPPELFQKIMNDIKQRKASDTDWANGFAPKPNNYLANRMWEEEIFNRNEMELSVKRAQKEAANLENQARAKAQAEFSEKESLRKMEEYNYKLREKKIAKERLNQKDKSIHRNTKSEVSQRAREALKRLQPLEAVNANG